MSKPTTKDLEYGYYTVYVAALPGHPEDVDPNFHLLWREVHTIVEAIREGNASLSKVTALLGITRHRLKRRLDKFGIPLLKEWRDLGHIATATTAQYTGFPGATEDQSLGSAGCLETEVHPPYAGQEPAAEQWQTPGFSQGSNVIAGDFPGGPARRAGSR